MLLTTPWGAGGQMEIPGYTFLRETDIRGVDVRPRYCSVSVWWCANSCAEESGCMAFTYVSEGRRTGDRCCYLKGDAWPSRLQGFRPGDSGVSYSKTDQPSPLEPPEAPAMSVIDWLQMHGNNGGAEIGQQVGLVC